MPLASMTHRDRGLGRLGAKGSDQAAVGQQRRVDPAGQVADVLESLGDLLLDLAEHLRRPFGVLLEQPSREAGLYGQGDQLLLRAVVDIALEPAPFGVLGSDDALPGGLELVEPLQQLLGQPDVAQDQPGPATRGHGQVLFVRA